MSDMIALTYVRSVVSRSGPRPTREQACSYEEEASLLTSLSHRSPPLEEG